MVLIDGLIDGWKQHKYSIIKSWYIDMMKYNADNKNHVFKKYLMS